MNIVVKEELRVYIDPLTPDEHEALERSLLAEGCRDALVLWGDVLVDGHNRFGICQKHGIPFQTMQHPAFKSMDDVQLWMIDQHLGRRSVSDFQRGVLALRKKDILAARVQAKAAGKTVEQSADGVAQADVAAQSGMSPMADGGEAPWDGATDATMLASAGRPADAFNSREAIARAARISSTTVSQIEKIQKAAVPELVAAVKAGEISINAAAVVASLPVEQQVAAVAGGKKELRQAARQVREAKAQARAAAVGEMLGQPQDEDPRSARGDAADEGLPPEQLIAKLRQTVAALSAENAMLKARLAELSPA